MNQLSSVLQLASPTLPIGGFTWSDGLETAVTRGDVHDVDSAAAWIFGRLSGDVAHLDLAVLARLHEAFANDDEAVVEEWNRVLHASRESAELRKSSLEMGKALARLLADLGEQRAESWRRRIDAEYPTLFALAALAWNVDRESTLHAFAFSFVDAQVAAAVKLVPLGQTDGQRLLLRARPQISRAVEKALSLRDEDIGFALPGLAIRSAQHEGQRVRLFRS